MKNGYYSENEDLSDMLVEFCKVPRSRAELISFTGKSRTYTMAQIIQPLVEEGILKLTLPDKPKSSKQRYVKA